MSCGPPHQDALGHEGKHAESLATSKLPFWGALLTGWPPTCPEEELEAGPLLVRPSLEGPPLGAYLAAYELTQVVERDLSGWVSSVEATARELGVRPVGAVLQRLYSVESSGVAYTVDPVTGDRVIVIQAVKGLHVDLIRGAATHDTFVVDFGPTRVLEVRVLPKPTHLVAAQGVLQRLPSPEPPDPSLSEDDAIRIASLAVAAEEAIKASPLEVEWAVKDRQVVLIAARPIPQELIGHGNFVAGGL
mgnify:CR=1 FL=1